MSFQPWSTREIPRMLILGTRGAMAVAESAVRKCAALIVDIAGTVALRAQFGDEAGGRRIRSLLETIIATSRAHGGEFIKSYGDDVLAIFDRDPIASAARVAVKAQQLAQEAGPQFYAGFHFGEVEFRETMGHPDALGLTVNLAARLHKLTEGAPGRIFFVEDALSALPADLRTRASLFGARDLKGVGQTVIWTLDWQPDAAATVITTTGQSDLATKGHLLLGHGSTSAKLGSEQKSATVGRGKDCAIRVLDPELRVSSAHVMFELAGGRWFVQDISRNGTWIRDARTGEEAMLPNCKQATLPREGVLCLGRPFANDAAGIFTVSFKLIDE